MMFRGRSVVEIMVLALTFTVTGAVFLVGLVIAIAEIKDPTTDTSTATSALLNIITGMLGALLGLLAGKSEALGAIAHRPEDDDEE